MNNNSTKNIEDSKEKKISCKLCKGETIFLGDHKVLSNKKTGVYFCKNCQSLFRFPMPAEEDLYVYYENIPFRKPTGYRRHFLHKRLYFIISCVYLFILNFQHIMIYSQN